MMNHADLSHRGTPVRVQCPHCPAQVADLGGHADHHATLATALDHWDTAEVKVKTGAPPRWPDLDHLRHADADELAELVRDARAIGEPSRLAEAAMMAVGVKHPQAPFRPGMDWVHLGGWPDGEPGPRTRRLRFVVELPKLSRLSKNARSNRWDESADFAVFKGLTVAAILGATQRTGKPRWTRAALLVRFVLPALNCDWDNLITAWKAGQDALVAQEIIPDDSVLHLPVFIPSRRLKAKREAPVIQVSLIDLSPPK